MRFKFSLKNTIIVLHFVWFCCSGVFHWCYVGIPLVFWIVSLVFRVMFSCSATVPGCSAVPPVFRVPVFLVLYKWQPLLHMPCYFEHLYMRSEVNSNWFEISRRFEMLFCLHGNLHGDLTAATFQTIARLYCTCANNIF